MNDFCTDCKYHSSVGGMSACAWKSGLASNYRKCEHYEKDWGFAITFYIFLIVLILFFLSLIGSLIGILLGVI